MEAQSMNPREYGTCVCTATRADRALSIAAKYGGIDGSHHRAWVIDQMVRALTGEDYDRFVAEVKAGEDGPDTYGWDTGIAP